MRTRDAVLAFQETQSSDGSTKTIELDITDPISALVFQFEAQNGTTNNQNNPLSMCVTEIQVVSGSDVLSKMSFEQLQALQWYKTGKQPFLRIDESGSDYNVIGAMLLFGRHLWDKDYALDLRSFPNPKLKITWNLAAVRAVSATTAFATGTFKISVLAKIMEDMPTPPNKFLMQKEIDSWTSGTSGDKRVDLPRDYMYRMLMLRTYVAGNDVDENISNLKLTCDTDKFIPFDRNCKEFRTEMGQLFGNITLWKRIHATSGDIIWVPQNCEPQVSLRAIAADVIPFYDWAWSGRFRLYLEDYASSAISSDTEIHSTIEGYGLHATIPVPMGKPDEPDTWFDPTPYKKFEFVGTEAAAAACSIVGEQVRPL